MKKQTFLLALLLTALSGSLTASAQANPAGSGTVADPYQIGTVADMQWFSAHVNEGHTDACAVLTADIDFQRARLTPIPVFTVIVGGGPSTPKTYAGTFDGRGHVLRNIALDASTSGVAVGLFDVVTGTVRNLGVEGLSYAYDTGGSHTGVVAGIVLTGGTIEHCYVLGSNYSGPSATRGIFAGANNGGTISHCWAYHEATQVDCFVGANATSGTASTVGTLTSCFCNLPLVGDTSNKGTIDGGAGSVSAGFFHNGKLTWTMNGGVTDGTQTWYQTLLSGSGSNQSFPSLDPVQGTVYYSVSCTGGGTAYSNSGDVYHANLTHIPANQSYCTTGNVEHWHCNGCGHDFADAACTTDITGHTVTAVVHNLLYHPGAATCTSEAYASAFYECLQCHACFSDADCTHAISRPAVTGPALNFYPTCTASDGWAAGNYTEGGTLYANAYRTSINRRDECERTITFEATADFNALKMRYYLQQPGFYEDYDRTAEVPYQGWHPYVDISVQVLVNGSQKYNATYGDKRYTETGHTGRKDLQLSGVKAGDVITMTVRFTPNYADRSSRTDTHSVTVCFDDTQHHQFVAVKEVVNACTGVIPAHWQCAHCGELFASNQHPDNDNDITTIDLLNTGHQHHALVHHTASEPTCTTPGSHDYYECTQCGKNFATDDVDATTAITADSYLLTTYHRPAVSPLVGHSGPWTLDETAEYRNVTFNYPARIYYDGMRDNSTHTLTFVVSQANPSRACVKAWMNTFDADESDTKLTMQLIISVNGTEKYNFDCRRMHNVYAYPLPDLQQGDEVTVTLKYYRLMNSIQGSTCVFSLEYAHDHTLSVVPGHEATCVGTVTQHWQCDDCGSSFSSDAEPGSEQYMADEASFLDPTTANPDGHVFDENGVCGYCGALQLTDGFYEISNLTRYNVFRDQLLAGHTDVCARLTADLDLAALDHQAMLGNFTDAYTGTFDGGGHTLNLAIGQSSPYGKEGTALFPRLAGTVRNLVLTGSVRSSSSYAASLAGKTVGNSTIDGCLSSVYLSATVNVSYYGGLVGEAKKGTLHMSHCGYTGTIDGYRAANCCGLIGSSIADPVVNSCFVSGFVQTNRGKGAVFSLGASDSCFTNCYRTSSWGTAQGRGLDASALADGTLTWLLNGRSADGVWHQTLGTDATPVPFDSHSAVYPQSIEHVNCKDIFYGTWTNDASLATAITEWNHSTHIAEGGPNCELCGQEAAGYVLDATLTELNAAGGQYMAAAPIVFGDLLYYAANHDFNGQLTYSREFGQEQKGKWQPLFVPFDITMTDELLAQCDVARPYFVATSGTTEDGMNEEDEADVVVVKKLKAGDVAPHGTPCFIRPKEAGTFTFTQADATLYQTDDTTILECSTTDDRYAFIGQYAAGKPADGTTWYALDKGIFVMGNDSSELPGLRWYMTKTNKMAAQAQAPASVMRVATWGEKDIIYDPLGITTCETDDDAPLSIYSVSGVRLGELQQGINIVNGKKIIKR